MRVKPGNRKPFRSGCGSNELNFGRGAKAREETAARAFNSFTFAPPAESREGLGIKA